ncbi:MAG: hypothetical protein H8E55_49220 [Pelagibacterales bacterium]|nr:hypothetical protein [Pelagibacterales bacterium]
MCRDKNHYRSISLRNRVYSKLGDLTEKVMPGTQLSRAKVVEKLINDSHSSLNATTNKAINETTTQNIKI